MKLPSVQRCHVSPRRAPYGARGLKLWVCLSCGSELKSRPVRGAWIETEIQKAIARIDERRAPYGARGLKLLHL